MMCRIRTHGWLSSSSLAEFQLCTTLFPWAGQEPPDRGGGLSEPIALKGKERAAPQAQSFLWPHGCAPAGAPQASAFDCKGLRPSKDRAHTCGLGPLSHPQKCHLQMGKMWEDRKEKNQQTQGRHPGRSGHSPGGKRGLSHGSGRKHRGPWAWRAGGNHAGLARGGEVCRVCGGFRGSPGFWTARKEEYLSERPGPWTVCSQKLPSGGFRPRPASPTPQPHLSVRQEGPVTLSGGSWHSGRESPKEEAHGSWYTQGRDGLRPCLSFLPFVVKNYTVLLYSTGNSARLFYASLGGRGVRGRMDTCIRVAESLPCSPETSTPLLISYTPRQSKKIFKSMVHYRGLS